jgi:hypothetical protein
MNKKKYSPYIKSEIKNTLKRLFPGKDHIKLLSSSPQNNTTIIPEDEIWKRFWFEYVLTKDVQKIWTQKNNKYFVNDVPTKLLQFDGSPKKMFSGKSNSIQNKIVGKLNDGTITENQAWEKFVKNINDGTDGSAHSFKETLGSGIDALDFIDEYGKPTQIGYRFVDECEKNNDGANGSIPMKILRFTFLKNGRYDTFLHYVFKVSEERFRSDPDAFFNNGTFNGDKYLNWLEDQFSKLRVINKVSQRAGGTRKPFQAERVILKKFGFLTGKMRRGLGLEINWPAVQRALEFEI